MLFVAIGRQHPLTKCIINASKKNCKRFVLHIHSILPAHNLAYSSQKEVHLHVQNTQRLRQRKQNLPPADRTYRKAGHSCNAKQAIPQPACYTMPNICGRQPRR